MKTLLRILLLFLTGCADDKVKSDHVLNFGEFSIHAPKGWIRVEAQGIDSYVGSIAIDNSDTLHFDLGRYSNSLTESEPQIIERSMLKDMPAIDTTEYVIVESRKHIDSDIYKRNKVLWDTIDGRKAKIVFPRQSGNGITGVYIDSLWHSGYGIDRFNLYGNNLKPANEKQLLKSIKTLKFRSDD